MNTELQDIRQYWAKKYPGVDVMLWENASDVKYFGKMISYESSFDLKADSIGELINLGESFLRKYK